MAQRVTGQIVFAFELTLDPGVDVHLLPVDLVAAAAEVTTPLEYSVQSIRHVRPSIPPPRTGGGPDPTVPAEAHRRSRLAEEETDAN